MNTDSTSFWQRARLAARLAARLGTQVLAVMAGLVVGCWPLLAAAEALSMEQQERALALADGQAWPVEDGWGTHTPYNDHTHELGIQTISIEQDVLKNRDAHNQVRVYQYRYANSLARVVIVSLADNRVIKQSLIDSVHLPLTAAEHQYALKVLAADVDATKRLKADHQRRGRTPFSHLNELSVKASIYKPLDKNAICIHERCALLSLFDKTNTVFAAEPIVNLQHGAVLWLGR